MTRIESIALSDNKGRTVVLNQRISKLLTGKHRDSWLFELPNILQLVFETGNLDSVYYLLQAFVNTPLNTLGPSIKKRSTLATYEAKLKFLQKLLDLDFSEAEFRSSGMSFRFHPAKRAIFWLLLVLVNEIVNLNAYNLLPENVKGNVVMDIGANLGVFSILAAKMGAKNVYAFEPVRSTYMTLRKNLEINNVDKVVQPINKALGDKIGIGWINYLFEGDLAASLELNKWRNFPQQECEVTTIDEFVRREDVSPNFIKIDSEGYEKKIILGGQNTIRASKPFMSICAYHKKHDVEELTTTVLSIRKDYRYDLLERFSKILYFY